MKRVALVVIVVLVASCTIPSLNTLAPPLWIWGSWAEQTAPANVFAFTYDDVTMTTSGISVDYKQLAASAGTSITDEVENGIYRMHVYNPAIDQTMTFTRVNLLSMNLSIDVGGVIFGLVLLQRH